MTLRAYQNSVELVGTVFTEGLIIEEAADRGEPATWSFTLDDPTGATYIAAHLPIQLVETASIYGTRIGSGYITNRGISRSDTSLTSNARAWNVQLVDLNAIFGFKVIANTTFHHKRPAETDLARVAWLISSSAGVLGAHDNGLVATTGGVDMPANEYAGQFPVDVLNDCAQTSGRTFFAYLDESAGQTSLFYHKPSDAVNTSPVSISNYPGEANNSTVFAPFGDAELRLDPAHLYSGVYMPYSGGVIYDRVDGRTLARDVVVPSANTTSRTTATARAARLLADYQSEEAQLTFTVRFPNTHVNAIKAGQRVAVKFSHLPGYSTSTYVRVVHRTIKPAPGSDNRDYDVTFECNDPIMVGPGSAPANSTVWPSQQPPYTPSGGTPFTYVQSAKTADGTNGADATFSATPTAGNFLTGILLVEQLGGGGASPSDFVAAWPDGWIVDQGPVGTTTGQRLVAMWMAHKVAGASEPTLVEVAVTIGATTPWNGFLIVAEYTGTGTLIAVDPGTYVPANASPPIPTVTPTGGMPALIVVCGAHEPNYAGTTASTGYNVRQEYETGGSRQALAYVDQLITSASGSYGGTLNLTGGTDDYSFIPVVVYSAQADSGPIIGQPVAPESATSNGVKVIYTTAYPYVPGSLVVKVNGVILANVTETSPSTGVFTLPAPPASGAIITWTYNVADTTPTGASNPPASSNPPAVPPDPGTVQGGDGVYRQPQQSYTPAEAPDGSRVTFTIVPYVAGQTIVYLNGLIQRKDIDWIELLPSGGTIQFSSAPYSTDVITIVAMPVTAAPTGSGFATPTNQTIYGSGINADTKANLQNNASAVSHRFKSVGGVLSGVRWQQRGGPVYSGGTGGAYNVTVEADVNGSPSGTPLATATFTPGNPAGGWTTYTEVTFGSPATLTANSRYHIVFTNTNGSPNVNYVSVNELFMYASSAIPAGQGRQPLFSDDDWAVLYGGTVQARYTANMDLRYASGTHQGMGYEQNMTTYYAGISGTTTMVREYFTVSGGDKSVVSAAVRVRRSSGSDGLVLGLYTSADALIEAVSVPASLIPISTAGLDTGGSAWAAARFLAAHTLTNGASYYLRLSCAGTSAYTAAPIRKGNDDGFNSATVFQDGYAQFTTNSGATWTKLYTFDTYAPDLQFYLGLST
jgi:hypothetical protein